MPDFFEMMHVISGFYREYAGKYPLKYTDFINLLNESYSGVGGPPQPLADRSLFVGRPTFPLVRSSGKMSFSGGHAVAFCRLASSYR